MPLERRDIEQALARKGFRLREGSHRYYHLVVNGLETGISTMISTGSSYKTYSDSLVGKIAGQLHLSKVELLRFIQCQLTEEEYVKTLQTRGKLKI